MEKPRIHRLKGFAPFLLAFLSACSTAPVAVQEPPFSFDNKQLFGEPPEIPSDTLIHQLAPSQEQAFLQYFNDPARQNVPAHRRVADYLELKADYFDYSDATLTAEQALRFGRGNCLSLAILTTAFAKLAGVETRYQRVESTPVYQLQGSVAVKALHVRSILVQGPSSDEISEGVSIFDATTIRRTPSLEYILRSDIYIDRSDIYVDFFASYFSNHAERTIQDIPYQEYLAMYYLNLAAEAIIGQDYVKAYWLTQEAMEHNPYSSIAFNYMAVIHRRIGDESKAELIYQYGIENLDDKLSLLKNYQALLSDQGRFDEAAIISQQIAKLDDPSPIQWYLAGKDALSSGEHNQAIQFFNRAIELAPYLHEAYLGLAQSYYQLGQLQAAESQLELAIENSNSNASSSLYQAKLTALNREIY